MTLWQKAAHAHLLYMRCGCDPFWLCRWRYYHSRWVAEITGKAS